MEKTIKASVIGLTNIKRELLDYDYGNYQWWMTFGINNGILSAVRAFKGYKQGKLTYREYPLPLRSRLIKDWFRTRKTKLTKDWIKIPNSKKKGVGLWLPLKFHQPLPKKYILKDSFLVRKRDKYYLHFCIETSEPELYVPKTIIGIDCGLKNPITLVDLKSRATLFLGNKLKQVKGKYFYLRRKLGEEKNLKMIKKIRNKEKDIVNSLLHQLSKDIVNLAYENKAAIAIGYLKHLKRNKGRGFNRKLASFSYFQLCKYLEYKARQKGVPFLKVSEYNTSKTCSVCGTMGKREKNWFRCEHCSHEDNADRNAAFNIGKRGLSYMLGSGAVASARKPITKVNGQAQSREIAQVCNLR